MLISRSVVRRKKKGRDLKAILRITFDKLVEKLNDYFAAIREEGQPATDYAAVLTDLGNAVDVDFERLQAADWAHLAELANDRTLRRARNKASAEVHRTLVNITNLVDGTHGEGTAEELLGLGIGLRNEPELMFEAASLAAVRLADPEFQFPEEGELDGVEVDREELLTQISGPLARLEDALRGLTDEEKKSVATLEAKELAIERFDKTYSRAANTLKAYLGFAGMDKQAARIRPKVRKRKASESETDPPEDDPIVETNDAGDELRVVAPENLPEKVSAENGETPAEPATGD